MLFKNFVNNGFRISYTRYVLSTPSPTTLAPRINIGVLSPSLGWYSEFVWEPTYNTGTLLPQSAGTQESQPMGYQTWVNNNMTNITGNSNLPWPYFPSGNTGGDGWWCTRACLLNATTNTAPSNARIGSEYRRSLATYVRALSNATLTPSQAQQAINDAIITNIQINIGSYNILTTSVVTELRIQAGAYDWTWLFGG